VTTITDINIAADATPTHSISYTQPTVIILLNFDTTITVFGAAIV
jgi:hypothetical protein